MDPTTNNPDHHDVMASLYDTDAGSGVSIWHAGAWHVADSDPVRVETLSDHAMQARLADVIAASDMIVWHMPDILARAQRLSDDWSVTMTDLDHGWVVRHGATDQILASWLMVGLHVDGECLNLDPWPGYGIGWADRQGLPIPGDRIPRLIP